MAMSRDDEYGLIIAKLVAGTINHHILSCIWIDGSEVPCDGCCPICCAPCWSLAWLRDKADNHLKYWLKLWDDTSLWSWQNENGTVNWTMIESHWHGCPNHEGEEDEVS